MVALPRNKLLSLRPVAVYHCWARCVRRAHLCGKDPVTGKDYSHRRQWILLREQQLAALCAIEIEFHAELANHLHLMLRTRPDVAKRWSRYEVARRWLTVARLAKCLCDHMRPPSDADIRRLAKNKKRIVKLRKRLSNISWFMGTLLENVARRANAEEETTGKFWDGRFRCRECVGDEAVLLCGLYIDLNPIRAGEARSPETARFSSIYQRLKSRGMRWDSRQRPDGWLGRLTWDSRMQAHAPERYKSRTGYRASDMGLLSITLEGYTQLLRWVARIVSRSKDTRIPRDLESLLDHLETEPAAWEATMEEMETGFCRAVGPPEALAELARQKGLRCMKGMSAARRIFRMADEQPAGD